MLEAPVLRIVPQPAVELPLRGLYLGLADGRPPDGISIFSNFVVSLDGRISVESAAGGPHRGVPPELAGARDWRLHQELAAQADVILTTGRYLRELEVGAAGPILTYPDDSDHADILQWRRERGLGDVPAFAIVSASLAFDPAVAAALGPRVIVLTGSRPPAERATELRRHGIDLVPAGHGVEVDGRGLADGLFADGFRLAFSAAGGGLLRLLVESRVLDHLFITQVHRILGGRRFATLVQGDRLTPTADFTLERLHLDTDGPEAVSQTFAVYSSAHPGRPTAEA